MNIAVIMTCHNRREKTLASLETLFNQILNLKVSIQVFLVDDGSTDGTAEAVYSAYPQVKILHGDGNLFWNRGMHLAFSQALSYGCDYYIWLNDDTLLEPTALTCLLNTYQQLTKLGKPNSIVVGSLCDPVTRITTYGGRWRPSRRDYFELIEPSEEPKEAETMNGNCVLVPRVVAEAVGSIDNVFTHHMGDFDYGLRARKLGCSVWVAPGYAGVCSRNFPEAMGIWTERELSIYERLRRLFHPKGLPPKEWEVFASRHMGYFWLIYWLRPYASLLLKLAFPRLMKSSA